MQYPIAIEWSDDSTAVAIQIPDLPDAACAGDTFEDAYNAAVEVAHHRLEELAHRGAQIPNPRAVTEYCRDPRFRNYGWGVIDIDVRPYQKPTRHV